MTKRRVPNIVRGGTAVPLGRNYYYMSGRKHEQGGIDVGRNPRTGIEVEDGEVMHIGNNEIKVFSAQPFLNGRSPAQRVISGDNPNDVFNAQERYKRRNKLNDDGTKKKRMGGQSPKSKYTTQLTSDEEKQFKDWYSKVAKYKNLNPNPDADGQDYDYRGYWKNEDRDGILGFNPNAHFTDKYKQPSHPTFSNESQYSSKETPGGQWVKGKGTWLFKHNKFTARQADRTADYLNGTGEGFILGTDTIIPNRRKRMGGDDIQYIYNKVNKKNTPDFIRMRNPKRKSIPDWRNNKYTSTNKVAVGTDSKGQVYLYNDIQDDGKGGLIDMSNPKNYKNGIYMGSARAEERGDTIHINSIQDGLLFSKDYKNYYPGFPKTKRMGGLSKSKDYGSKSKPYPSVKSGDFAGGGRSYPIPTKADAVDALRLAGLHGRSDVKAKVYAKYPELRRKARNGGLYSVTVDGKTTLKPFPKRKKVTLGIDIPDNNRLDIIGINAITPNITPNITPSSNNINIQPVDLNISNNKRFGNKISSFFRNNFNRNNIPTLIGGIANFIGNNRSYKANKKFINSLHYANSPIQIHAPKLKTRINIAPQLDAMRESLANYERNINNNTASSQVALVRNRAARLNNILLANNIYANKENKETELINNDRINRGNITAKNIESYNNYQNGLTAFRNSVAEKNAENEVSRISNNIANIQNIVNSLSQNRNFGNTLIAQMATAPNVNPEYLRALGADWITDEMIRNYKEANRKN